MMVVNKILILGKLITLLGIFLSLIVACQYAYIGSLKEIVITGFIGLSNVFAFYIFSNSENI